MKQIALEASLNVLSSASEMERKQTHMLRRFEEEGLVGFFESLTEKIQKLEELVEAIYLSYFEAEDDEEEEEDQKNDKKASELKH